jgi:hypothetical protein
VVCQATAYIPTVINKTQSKNFCRQQPRVTRGENDRYDRRSATGQTLFAMYVISIIHSFLVAVLSYLYILTIRQLVMVTTNFRDMSQIDGHYNGDGCCHYLSSLAKAKTPQSIAVPATAHSMPGVFDIASVTRPRMNGAKI